MQMELTKTKPTDEWVTPEVVFKSIEHITQCTFGLDACADDGNTKCARFLDSKIDGLASDWDGYGDVFWNPPYSNIPGWCEQAVSQRYENKLRVTSVGLLRSDTSTKWFHKYSKLASLVIFLKPRIRFLPGPGMPDATSNPFGSVLFAFSDMSVPVGSNVRVHLFDWQRYAQIHERKLWEDYRKRIR